MNELKIHLLDRIDCLKSNWYVWTAYREMPVRCNGIENEYGTVQADHQGELIAPETWEADE